MKAVIGTSAIAAAVLLGSLTTASAEIACSGNTCWHVRDHYAYPPEAKVIVHEDSWRWRPEERYEWREHEGRGYWRDRDWVQW